MSTIISLYQHYILTYIIFSTYYTCISRSTSIIHVGLPVAIGVSNAYIFNK